MEIRDRLKALRHAMGLTQEQFAARIGLPKRTVVGYENGEREPGFSALSAIAGSGVNMGWLLTGEGDMLPQSEQIKEESAAYDSKYSRRWGQIVALVNGIEDEDAREAFIQEIFARAQEKAEIADLHRAVRELRAASSQSK